MRLFFASLSLELKRAFFSRWFVIIIVIVGLLIGGVHSFSSQDSPFEINIGVVFEPDDDFAKAVFQRLVTLDVANFTAIEQLSEEDIQQKVISGQLETVYYLNPDLNAKVAGGFLKNSVSKLVSPTSTLTSLVDEWIFSSILIEASPDISVTEIQRILKVPPAESYGEVAEKLSWYEDNYNYVKSTTSWEGGIAETRENLRLGWVRVYHGIISLTLLLYAAVNLSSLVARLGHVDTGLSAKGRPVFRLASLLSFILSGLIIGAAGLFFIKLFDPATLRPLELEIVSLLAYLFFLGSLVIFVSGLLKSNDSVFSASIFLVLSFIFLGGVLYTPLEVSSWLDRIAHIFPSYFYANSIIFNSYSPLIYLLLGGIFCTILSLVTSLFHRRRV